LRRIILMEVDIIVTYVCMFMLCPYALLVLPLWVVSSLYCGLAFEIVIPACSHIGGYGRMFAAPWSGILCCGGDVLSLLPSCSSVFPWCTALLAVMFHLLDHICSYCARCVLQCRLWSVCFDITNIFFVSCVYTAASLHSIHLNACVAFYSIDTTWAYLFIFPLG